MNNEQMSLLLVIVTLSMMETSHIMQLISKLFPHWYHFRNELLERPFVEDTKTTSYFGRVWTRWLSY